MLKCDARPRTVNAYGYIGGGDKHQVGLQTAIMHTKKKKPFHQLGDICFCSLQFSLTVAV